MFSISRDKCRLVDLPLNEFLVVVESLLRDLPDALVGVEGHVGGQDDVVHGGEGGQRGEVHEAAATHVLNEFLCFKRNRKRGKT